MMSEAENEVLDAIEYLRKYNAWRRGSDEYPAPGAKIGGSAGKETTA